MKKLFLVLILISIFYTYYVNSDTIECNIRENCSSDETIIFSLYSETNSNVINDTFGAYKVCCPNDFYNIMGSYGKCGGLEKDDIILKAQDTKLYPLNALASIPESDPDYKTTNICLSLNEDIEGKITCYSNNIACNDNDFGIVSLSQEENSQVGAYSEIINPNLGSKICCNVIQCPSGFIWDSEIQDCEPNFPICYLKDLSTNIVDQDQFCKTRWQTPITQLDDYWKDAQDEVNDCFLPPNNAQACCYIANFNNKEYGKYQGIMVKRIGVMGI